MTQFEIKAQAMFLWIECVRYWINWWCIWRVCVYLYLSLSHSHQLSSFIGLSLICWWHCVDRHEKYAHSKWHVSNIHEKSIHVKFFESITQWMRDCSFLPFIHTANNMWRGYKSKTMLCRKMNRRCRKKGMPNFFKGQTKWHKIMP